MREEHLLALLEADAVGNALSLHALEAGTYHVPVAAVHHDRHAADVRFAGKQIEEMCHLALSVQQAVVHIDVDDHGSVFHLTAGYLERLFISTFLDETKEFA